MDTTSASGQVNIFLNWDQYGNSVTDLDLYVYTRLGSVKASSIGVETGTQSPAESVSFAYISDEAPYGIVVDHWSGPTAVLDLTIFSFNNDLEHAVAASSLMDPANAHGAFTAAAIDQAEWTLPGPQAEPYSSQGPTNDGRLKPDIAAPDGTTSRTYGFQGSFGTSFSSPTTAGAAALLLDEDPTRTASDLATRLSALATDIGEIGADTTFGAGQLHVEATSLNQPPVANAGPDQSVNDSDGTGAETVNLDGSGSSDPDGVITGFEWAEGATVLGTTATITPSLSVGTHTITLTVTDNGNATDSDIVVVTVNAQVNEPPIANAGPDQTVTDTDGNGVETVTLDGSGSSDPDGTIASYQWKEGATVLGTTAVTNPSLSVGTHTITLTVMDNGGASASDPVVVTIDPQPATPPQTKVLAVTDGYDQSAETTLVQDGKVYTVLDIDGDTWETEALYFTSYSFQSASLSQTENIISVKIELTHYEESEFKPESTEGHGWTA